METKAALQVIERTPLVTKLAAINRYCIKEQLDKIEIDTVLPGLEDLPVVDRVYLRIIKQ